MNNNNNLDNTNLDNKDIDSNNITNNNSNNTRIYNIQNLKPITTLSSEEAKKRGSSGGKKSVEVRRQRKTAQELLKRILATELSDEQIEEILGNAGSLLNGDKSSYNVMLVRMLQQAMAGSEKAALLIRDTVGDKPADTSITLTDAFTEKDRQEIEKMKKIMLS